MDIDQRCRELASIVAASDKKYDVVVAVLRGGAIPATYISYKLDLPLIAVSPANIDDNRHMFNASDAALLVDDIADSGSTLGAMLQHLPYTDVDIAVLDWRLHTSAVIPTYAQVEFAHNDWIVYPWDVGVDTVSQVVRPETS